MKRLPLLLGICTLTLFILPSFATAQTTTPSQLDVPATQPERGLNLTLSPTYISLTTDPGKPVSSQFRITNNNTFTEYLRVTVAKMEVGADGSPILADIEEGDEFAQWITIPEQEFSLEGSQNKVVRFSINPPEEAALGYYYTLLVSRIPPEDQIDQSQAVITGSAGITVLVDVRSPNAKKELQVSDFTTDRMFYEYLPTTFQIRVKNSGNVHTVPFGDIFIDSLFNKEIAVLPANPGRGNVLPQSEREFTAVWNDAFAVRVPKMENGVVIKDGQGQEQYETKYDFSKADKFRIGKYTAHLLLVYDNGERDVPVEATISFWVIPWKIILGIIAVIIAPALLVYLLMRWRYGKRR